MSDMHYVLTLQWSAPSGQIIVTFTGTTPADGRTRQQMYEALFADATNQVGTPRVRTSVLFFCLEPNEVANR
jgi:hypothetical protein